MGQIERALNRMYGIELDRPTAQKYGRAFVLTISAGVLSWGPSLLSGSAGPSVRP
jgi:hypothetical protein